MVDMVVPRGEMQATIARVLNLLREGRGASVETPIALAAPDAASGMAPDSAHGD